MNCYTLSINYRPLYVKTQNANFNSTQLTGVVGQLAYWMVEGVSACVVSDLQLKFCYVFDVN